MKWKEERQKKRKKTDRQTTNQRKTNKTKEKRTHELSKCVGLYDTGVSKQTGWKHTTTRKRLDPQRMTLLYSFCSCSLGDMVLRDEVVKLRSFKGVSRVKRKERERNRA